jgi:chaperonin GroEL
MADSGNFEYSYKSNGVEASQPEKAPAEPKRVKLRDKTNYQICKDNGIKYQFMTNTVEEKDAKSKIRVALAMTAKLLNGTLGPYGTTTIIEDAQGHHFATKDGYDLMNRIQFQDATCRTVVDLVRQLAKDQVFTVGDGSTSAIIVANALYSELTDFGKNDFLAQMAPKDITDILEDISEYLEDEISKEATPLSPDMHELETIAKISLNNDAEAGRLVSDIYRKIGKNGFISTDVLERCDKDRFEVKEGLEWKRGYIDPCFGDFSDNRIVKYDDRPYIFITNSTLTGDDIQLFLADLIKRCCVDSDSRLLIVCNDYDDYVHTFFKNNRIKHLGLSGAKELDFTVVDIDQVTRMSRNNLKDLALMVGCKIYDKVNSPAEYQIHPEQYLGRAEKVTVTEKMTQIISDKEKLDSDHRKLLDSAVGMISQRVHDIKEKEANVNLTVDEDAELTECLMRLSTLQNSNAVIHVAGSTISARQTRERLFDDAIYACKSAIQYGYVNGGNIVIPRILSRKEDFLADMLADRYSFITTNGGIDYEVAKYMGKVSDKGAGTAETKEDRVAFFRKFIRMIKNAFLESYRNVLDNSMLPEDAVEAVIDRCVKEDVFYNLKKHRFELSSETEVINSAKTDMEILETCMSLIGILATSNQVITLSPNVRSDIIDQ